ncbi:unnamed protein product [Diabrotica balteata]|uniref:Uncharacterized protein n=1 Tax=Diabrotica balteata TaxID=107213 RepID=A0A9N9SRL6_DIABA|nr:unnamed protein product [Diabrotica balteata]
MEKADTLQGRMEECFKLDQGLRRAVTFPGDDNQRSNDKKMGERLKVLTEMPGVTVLATIRGCYQRPDHEMMGTVVTGRHSVIKKHFHLCNHTLCNEGTENFRIRDSTHHEKCRTNFEMDN